MKKLFASLVFMAVATGASLGQAISTNGGSIQGTITDPTGAAVPNATVTISSSETGFSKTIHTDGSGYYAVGPLVPGNYTISVAAANFSKLATKTIVHTGTVTPGSEKLALGSSSETVEVNAGALQVNTDQIAVSNVITSDQINTLPVNGRNILDVAQIEPGVILQSAESFDPTKAGYSGISVGGVSSRSTRILLDGQDITDENVGTTLFNVPSGAVDELQLNRSTQDVSGDVTSTGQVLVTTRSGTNKFHGSLFYNFQDHRAGFAGVQGVDEPFQRNQFGGYVGGYLIKDKLFFYGGGERTKQDEKDVAQSSPKFAAILKAYPYTPAPFRDTFSMGRLDYNGPRGIHFFARAAYSVNADSATFGLGPYEVYQNRDNVPTIVGGADFTTGSFTHSFRVGYEKFHNILSDGTAALGTSIYNPYPAGSAVPVSLYDSADGFYAGPNIEAPQTTYQSDKQFRYDGTWTKKAHNIHYGFSMNRILGGGSANFYGLGTVTTFSASRLLATCDTTTPIGGFVGTTCPGDPRYGYHAGSVLVGNGNGYSTEKPGFGLPAGGLDSWRFGAYVADTWKVTPAFTLTAGLRWSVDTNRANQDVASPLCSQIDPSLQFNGCTGNTYLWDQYQAGLGGTTHQPYGNFGPQAGFVFSPGSHKLSLHGGAGLYYESNIFNNVLNSRSPVLQKSGLYFADANVCTNLYPGTNLNITSAGGESITQLCTKDSIAHSAPIFAGIRSQYQTQAKGVAIANPNYIGDPNGYDLIASGLYAQPYLSPYSIQLNGGMQLQLKKGLLFSADFVHSSTLKVPLSIDYNHQGAARYLNAAYAQAAIRGVTAPGYSGCGGTTSAADINCAIAAGATIEDFAENGLESAGNPILYGGYPANQTGAAFQGRNPNVGEGSFITPSGRSGYDALQLVLQEQQSHPLPGIVSSNLQLSYSLARSISSASTGNGDQFFNSGALDNDQPNAYMGRNSLDHTNMLNLGGNIDIKYGLRVGMIGHFYSAGATSLALDSGDGIGAIFTTDVTGDGTTADLVPGTLPGQYMHGGVKGDGLNRLIRNYNATQAGRLTPAGQALVSQGLFTQSQLVALGATQQPIALAPGTPIPNSMFRTFDANVAYPIRLGKFHEGLAIIPGVSMYNVFNMSNFGRLTGTLLNTTDAGGAVGGVKATSYLNGPNTAAIQNGNRVARGSGTFDQGGPRTTEFQLKVEF